MTRLMILIFRETVERAARVVFQQFIIKRKHSSLPYLVADVGAIDYGWGWSSDKNKTWRGDEATAKKVAKEVNGFVVVID